MTVSDLLTIIGILLAIVALISDRNRQFINLKFTKRNWIFIGIAFLLVHLLVSYDWLSSKITYLHYLEIEGFPTPSAWAYLITLGLLFYICLKIFYLNFPLVNREKVVSFYKNLLHNDESTLLLDQIDNYHAQNIVEFLKLRKSIKVDKEDGFLAWKREYEKREEVLQEKLQNKSNLKYGRAIYHGIITNELFLKRFASIRPYLFAPIIQELDKENVANSDFINNYLRYLCQNKNELFFREVRDNQNFADFESYRIENQRPILYALFHNIKVASLNEAYSGVGEPAIAELRKEGQKSHSLLREKETERIGDLYTIWSYRVTIAIWYFDIMVREAIVQDTNKHMWMFYYRYFIKGLINNMDETSEEKDVENGNTRNFDLIELILEKMRGWIEVSRLSKNPDLIDSIYSCIGACVNEVIRTDRLSQGSKMSIISLFWSYFIHTSPDDPEDRNEIEMVNNIIDKGFQMMYEPSSLINARNTDNARNEYEKILVGIWEGRDEASINGFVADNAEKFRANVIEQIR